MGLYVERWVGKVAVVTGASAGIGAGIAEELVRAGLKVVGLARRQEKIDDQAKSLVNEQGKLYSFKCDVTKEEEIIKALEWVEGNIGPIQILVNNAGLFQDTNMLEGNTEQWKKTFDVNVWGYCIAMREGIKLIRKNNFEGHIININSVYGHMNHKLLYHSFSNVYSSSKCAVTAITGTYLKELQLHEIKNIKVTSLSPGTVETDILTTNLDPSKPHPNFEGEPLPTLYPKDVADAVIYILSTPPHVEIRELIIQPLHEAL